MKLNIVRRFDTFVREQTVKGIRNNKYVCIRYELRGLLIKMQLHMIWKNFVIQLRHLEGEIVFKNEREIHCEHKYASERSERSDWRKRRRRCMYKCNTLYIAICMTFSMNHTCTTHMYNTYVLA